MAFTRLTVRRARAFDALDSVRARGSGASAHVPAGSGAPLDATTRASMERGFGFDFRNVRIHADDEASQRAHHLGAKAYTVGSQIVFGAGQYQPHSPAGRRLLAHELTHVVQQSAGGSNVVQRQPDVQESPEAKSRGVDLATYEMQWNLVKTAAKGSKTAAPWIADGDAIIALMRSHTAGAIGAINNPSLYRQYAAVLETDLIAYEYVLWHAFAYQNIDRVSGWVSGLVSSFDADSRAFTGRTLAEAGARALKGLSASIKTDSASALNLIRIDVPFKLTGAGGAEVAITLTSAGDRKYREAMVRETEEIRKLEEGVEFNVANLNQFVSTAQAEGFAQAVEAVEEFYKVKAIIDAAKGPKKREDKPKEDKQPKPDAETKPGLEPAPVPLLPPEEGGGGGRWGCDDVRCNVYAVDKGATCPPRVIGSSRGWPSYDAACKAAQRHANSQVPRGCNKRHCNCTGKCRKM